MPYDLLIAAGPGEWRAALVEDSGEPVELYVERGDRRPAGSIHLGRVVRRAPGLDSAFVEIGDPRPGLVPLREAAGAGIALDEGARVIVQVRREAQPDKGARLTTRIAPRTPGLDPTALAARAAARDPPAQLDPAPGFAAALELAVPELPERIITDDPATVPELRAVFAEAEIAAAGADEFPLDLDAAFAAATAPRLPLPDGGAVHIEDTHAAVMIDVDTGTPDSGSAARAALARNLAAARLIARQSRLRNLGGGIVIDFVGIEGRTPRERVRQELAAAFAADPAAPQVLGWTRLGHLEAVRPYRSPSLAAILGDPGTTAAFAALRALLRQARAEPAVHWALAARAAVAAALRGAAAAGLGALEARLGRRVEVVALPSADDGGRPFEIVPR